LPDALDLYYFILNLSTFQYYQKSKSVVAQRILYDKINSK